MKILAWNIRGSGSFHKHAAIKSTIRAVSPILVGIFETKVESFEPTEIVAFWGGNGVAWEVSPAVNRAGGLLLIWDNSAVTMYNVFSSLKDGFA